MIQETEEILEVNVEDLHKYLENGEYEIETPNGFETIGDCYIKKNKKCYKIILEIDDFNLECSEDHLLRTPNGELINDNYWTKCKDLKINDKILTRIGWLAVLEIIDIGEHDTYDLEVLSNDHQYYSNNIVSHNCGKTAKIIQDMQDFLDWNINPKWKDKVVILYDSFEMTGWRNYLRVLSNQLSVTVKQLIDYKVKLANEQFERIKQVGEVFRHKPLFISSEMVNGDTWYNKKLQIHNKLPPDHLIINVLDHTRLILKNNEKTEEQKLTGLMMNAMTLKNKTECINIFLSQMNRNIENGVVDRSEIGSRTPVMSDLFGSDAIGQCADVVMALHRPGQYGLDVFNKQGTSIPTSKIVNGNKVDYLLLECILKNRDGSLKDIAMDHNLAHNKIIDLNLNKAS